MDTTASRGHFFPNIITSGLELMPHPPIDNTSVPCPHRHEHTPALQENTGANISSPQASPGSAGLSTMPASGSSRARGQHPYRHPQHSLAGSYDSYHRTPTDMDSPGWSFSVTPNGDPISNVNSHLDYANMGPQRHSANYANSSVQVNSSEADAMEPMSLHPPIPEIVTTTPEGHLSPMLPRLLSPSPYGDPHPYVISMH